MLNIVVARRGEDVRWIDSLPEHCAVTVYSDDASIGAPLDITRHIELVRLPGQHSVGALYLSHLRRARSEQAGAFTVFCPGDPLQVSPDFFELLDVWTLWGDVQPLSRPPGSLTDRTEARDWLADWPVAPVRFDLRSWAPLGAFDKAAYRMQQRYHQIHLLSEQRHPAVHFLEACHLKALAEAVARHDLGVRDSGLLFAVRQSRISDWLAAHGDALPYISEWLRSDPSHDRIWDQFWLHLFGLPFVRLEGLTSAGADVVSENDEVTEDFSLSRALATIDDTLARLAPPPLKRQTDRLSALQLARLKAASERNAPRPQAHSVAIPMTTEQARLSEQAAQAFREGHLERAITCARQALRMDASHTTSRFTLAMALAAQGHHHDAMEQFEHLLHLDAQASDRLGVPDLTVSVARPQ